MLRNVFSSFINSLLGARSFLPLGRFFYLHLRPWVHAKSFYMIRDDINCKYWPLILCLIARFIVATWGHHISLQPKTSCSNDTFTQVSLGRTQFRDVTSLTMTSLTWLFLLNLHVLEILEILEILENLNFFVNFVNFGNFKHLRNFRTLRNFRNFRNFRFFFNFLIFEIF